MKKTTKILAAVLVPVILLSVLCSCGGKTEDLTTAENSATKVSMGNTSGGTNVKSIRFLNFKPEATKAYQKIADAYERETGVKVIVETAANNKYEETLMSKMATNERPTLFQVNGPRGYASWKNYCADLTDTKLYEHLTDKSLAIKSGDRVYAIPFLVEGYGIIYNTSLTDKYFALDNKGTNFNSMDDINSFTKLKQLCDDMQKNKEKLGIDGVFASTSLKPGEDWRWQTHLANVALYYEFDKNKTDLTSDEVGKINFDYAENFKNIFDLYTTDSVVAPSKLGTKTVIDSMAEFAMEKCVMVQNGNWAWGQIKDVSGNKVKAENIKYLPIYTGAEGEEKQGLCIGTENFICINSKASADEQQAAADFIYWLYSSEEGKKMVTNDLGFIAPFDTFSENEKPTDPLAKEVLSWMEKDGVTTIPWNFTIFPSQTFKDDFGSDLLQYSQGKIDFKELKNRVVKNWESESKNAA